MVKKTEQAIRSQSFTQGFACAVATLIRLEGLPSTAAMELFRDGIGTISNCIDANVDEYDLEILKQHFK